MEEREDDQNQEMEDKHYWLDHLAEDIDYYEKQFSENRAYALGLLAIITSLIFSLLAQINSGNIGIHDIVYIAPFFVSVFFFGSFFKSLMGVYDRVAINFLDMDTKAIIKGKPMKDPANLMMEVQCLFGIFCCFLTIFSIWTSRPWPFATDMTILILLFAVAGFVAGILVIYDIRLGVEIYRRLMGFGKKLAGIEEKPMQEGKPTQEEWTNKSMSIAYLSLFIGIFFLLIALEFSYRIDYFVFSLSLSAIMAASPRLLRQYSGYISNKTAVRSLMVLRREIVSHPKADPNVIRKHYMDFYQIEDEAAKKEQKGV